MNLLLLLPCRYLGSFTALGHSRAFCTSHDTCRYSARDKENRRSDQHRSIRVTSIEGIIEKRCIVGFLSRVIVQQDWLWMKKIRWWLVGRLMLYLGVLVIFIIAFSMLFATATLAWFLASFLTDHTPADGYHALVEIGKLFENGWCQIKRIYIN